jgi:membrane protein YfhO
VSHPTVCVPIESICQIKFVSVNIVRPLKFPAGGFKFKFDMRMPRFIGKWMIVLAGIVAGQFILYGPSLAGQRVLLPLDLLGLKNAYLPRTPDIVKMPPQDAALVDLVFNFEPARQFAIAEFHAGRLPMWTPYQFAGAPVVWPKFSPFMLLECCAASPVILAWTQLVAAIVAGFGAHLFFRRVLAVGFWPAAIASWCYPMTGFFIFWQGFPTCAPVYWFPWLLLAVDCTARRTGPFAAIGLSLTTGLVLVSGALDVGAQVLLASGFYAVWRLLDAYRGEWSGRSARRAVFALTLGWVCGFLLASPYLLPLLEYAHTGARMQRRAAGAEERPPVGLSALPQIILPDMYGTTQAGSVRIPDEIQIESSAATYAGVIATLFVAPLAFCSRRHHSINVFWCLLILFSLSWCLNVPGIVALLRLPGLNMMSHNRFVFAASFAILAMTATGLDALWNGTIVRRWWFWIPAAVLAGLFVWCFCRSIFLPEPVATQITQSVARGEPWRSVHNLDDVRQVQAWFARSYAAAAVWCALGFLGWLILWRQPKWPAWAVSILGCFLLADLIWFAHDRSPQCDPALYYPRIPALEKIAASGPGRIIGFSCLPATLAQTHGLLDVRGYDAIDPARLMDLMMKTADPRSPDVSYAMTQWFIPQVGFLPPDGVRLSPILDMLGVRYVIFRGPVLSQLHPAIQSDDYWVMLNRAALPRAFVPGHVETVPNDSEELEKLSSPQFDPRAVAYVESPVNLPGSCRGRAEIISEIPTRVTLSVQMETSGLVVLSDSWDKGWNAYLNGRRVPILRVNHAVRGVIVPAGDATLEFRYEPASFTLGLCLSALAAAILLCSAGIIFWTRRAGIKSPSPPADSQNSQSS